jgi:hypothetical protein
MDSHLPEEQKFPKKDSNEDQNQQPFNNIK